MRDKAISNIMAISILVIIVLFGGLVVFDLVLQPELRRPGLSLEVYPPDGFPEVGQTWLIQIFRDGEIWFNGTCQEGELEANNATLKVSICNSLNNQTEEYYYVANEKGEVTIINKGNIYSITFTAYLEDYAPVSKTIPPTMPTYMPKEEFRYWFTLFVSMVSILVAISVAFPLVLICTKKIKKTLRMALFLFPIFFTILSLGLLVLFLANETVWGFPCTIYVGGFELPFEVVKWFVVTDFVALVFSVLVIMLLNYVKPKKTSIKQNQGSKQAQQRKTRVYPVRVQRR